MARASSCVMLNVSDIVSPPIGVANQVPALLRLPRSLLPSTQTPESVLNLQIQGSEIGSLVEFVTV